MAGLLNQLIEQNVAVDYIGRILVTFREDEHRSTHCEFDHLSAQSLTLSTQPLVEPLTNCELDVLAMLAHRLSNKEIAAKLFISPETVKKHLNNIYGKLNVSSRQQAVDQCQKLNILPQR
jgi:ATP/maltotriose-dependent transcriptional regulator MalT